MLARLDKTRWTVSVALAGLSVVGLGAGVASATHPIDGKGNNVTNVDWGSAGEPLTRLMLSAYADEISTPAGDDRPSARAVSNGVCFQLSSSVPNMVGATDFVWQWGQFVDHDISLTGAAFPSEAFDIPVPTGDAFFDPDFTGSQVIPFDRSVYAPVSSPRQQLNGITAFIDASNVYGSDAVRAAALRSNDGTGSLKMSQHRLLPFNTDGLPNAGGPDPTLFLAGDVRANEQVGLTALHTLFVREHNRLANEIAEDDGTLSGDEIYNRAREIVIAQMQVITYNDFLPVLLGPNALSPYSGYNPTLNPGISNGFSTAAYRFGHSMLSPTLLRLKKNGHPIPAGHLPLRDAFFNPHELIPSVGKGIEPLLRGLASQAAQDVDVRIVDDVRNFLFGLPGQGGFDLAALNIQRGRDHGLPSYNEARMDFGLGSVTSFAEITSDPGVETRLMTTYAHVDDIDLWVGGIAEDHVAGALVGELVFTILKEQFEALRDGDRFWYQNVFTGEALPELEDTTLADIIRRNTKIKKEIQDNVFLLDS